MIEDSSLTAKGAVRAAAGRLWPGCFVWHCKILQLHKLGSGQRLVYMGKLPYARARNAAALIIDVRLPTY
jgi:hypothetical protein